MQIIVHLIVGEFFPDQGGLAQSVDRLVQLLATDESVIPIVYVRSGRHIEAMDTINGVRVVYLAQHRHSWETPLVESAKAAAELASERTRLDFLNLRRLISVAMKEEPGSAHIILSFYILNHGFVAQRVASALSLPHIAAIRGTDFSRGFQDPATFPSIAHVAMHANLVVTCNVEQTLACRYIGVPNVKMIYSSIRPQYVNYRWRPRGDGRRVRLFSDAGYSFKKGTHVLLRAFATLAEEGVPIDLEIVGGDRKDEEEFWSRLREQFRSRFGSRVALLPHVSIEEVYGKLLQCDVYGSATLGEGCSSGRIGALSAGVPIVSTRCGELDDIGASLARVWVSEPADEIGFTTALRKASDVILEGEDFALDEPVLADIRKILAPSREQREWLEALHVTWENTS